MNGLPHCYGSQPVGCVEQKALLLPFRFKQPNKPSNGGYSALLSCPQGLDEVHFVSFH
jgi:hypothetical protein